jgi:hypothetical protein
MTAAHLARVYSTDMAQAVLTQAMEPEMSIEIRSVLATIHPPSCTLTTMDQEDAYYRAHTLTEPLWLTIIAARARHLRDILVATQVQVFHRRSHGQSQDGVEPAW